MFRVAEEILTAYIGLIFKSQNKNCQKYVLLTILILKQ